MAKLPAPEGFAPYSGRSPFVLHAADYYARVAEGGEKIVGCWIGHDQSNTEGFAHGGFYAAFADFALSDSVMGITLSLTLDYLRPARLGDWIEAEICERKRSDSLIFADAMIRENSRDLVRISGVFRPFKKRMQMTSEQI